METFRAGGDKGNEFEGIESGKIMFHRSIFQSGFGISNAVA